MFSYIKGILEEVEKDCVIIECNQIGYQIHVTGYVLENLPAIGSDMKLYTYLQVKEDGIRLFGFLTKDDLQVFCFLLGVSGVGPKGALAVLTAMPPNDLRLAVSTQDAKAISKAQGIGVKTAQRIIIDLKDKLKLEDMFLEEAGGLKDGDSTVSKGNHMVHETIEALIALGYSQQEASRAVRQIRIESCQSVEACIKEALKKMVF